MTGAAGEWRLGVDVGGTFTDVVLAGAGRVLSAKVPSRRDDYALGILDGIEKALAQPGAPDAAEIASLHHATTIATNAIIERRGALTGLITTEGFRDVLELRRMRFPETYHALWQKPPALVDRRLRTGVAERIGADGAVVLPLDTASADAAAELLVEGEGVAAIAVSLINAYASAEHEQLIGARLRERYPDVAVSLSSDVLPEIREYERTSTTVANAYLMPIIGRYLDSLLERLRERGIGAPVFIMQSGGGVTSVETVKRYPVHLLESGASAGVVGARELVRAAGRTSVVTFDMGGTTAKASTIEDYEPLRTDELEIGADVGLAGRLLRGGGYTVRVPSVDVAEVGAGGGSLVHIDAAGALHVGPRSAGALPGPACYGRGGTQATVTDANLVLGYLNPAGLVGGELKIDAEAGRAAVQRVADELGRGLHDTAAGIHELANAQMVRALRSVTVERGRDIAAVTLVAYGGCGPVHTAGVAQALGIRRIVVPLLAGSFSALGLLAADTEFQVVRTLHRELRALDPAEVDAAFAELERDAVAHIERAREANGELRIDRWADLHYRGQWHEERVALGSRRPGASAAIDLAEIEEAFHRTYERRYGVREAHEPVMLVNLRAAAVAPSAAPAIAASALRELDERRVVHFSLPGLGAGEPCEVPVVGRGNLRGATSGPLVIEDIDTSIVVPPAWSAAIDDQGNVTLETDV